MCNRFDEGVVGLIAAFVMWLKRDRAQFCRQIYENQYKKKYIVNEPIWTIKSDIFHGCPGPNPNNKERTAEGARERKKGRNKMQKGENGRVN